MTPGEHITEAERQLDILGNAAGAMLTDEVQARVLIAAGHALIAVAVELGAPHAPEIPGGDQGASAQAGS